MMIRAALDKVLMGCAGVWLGVLAAVWLVPATALAEDMESDAVYIPAPVAEALVVRNPLGTVRVEGWDQPQVRIVAQKRAGSAAALGRLKVRVDLEGGRVQITTGFYLADHTFYPLPLQGAAIDLAIDAPRGMALTALTFAGDIDAAGFRAGAHLTSQGGQIRVADLVGPVDTRTLEGNQWLAAIRGSLDASGVVGDMALADIEGQRVGATVFKGQITARDVSAALVRLRTTVGSVVFEGKLIAGARYDFATRDGDVRLTLQQAPFSLTARARTVETGGFGLARLEERPGLSRGVYGAGPGAQLELASAHGAVRLLRAW